LILSYGATDFLPQPGHHLIIWTRRRSTDSRPRITHHVEYHVDEHGGPSQWKEYDDIFIPRGIVQSTNYKRAEFSIHLVDTSDDIVSIIPDLDDGCLGLVLFDGSVIAFNSRERTLEMIKRMEHELLGERRLVMGIPHSHQKAYDLLAKYGVKSTDIILDACLSPDGSQLAAGDTLGTICLWDVYGSAEPRIIDPRISCRGMHIRGAKGLDAPAPSGEGTLREWLLERGAVD
jgi:WD40 repeat protein